MMKKKMSKTISYEGINFAVRFSYPSNIKKSPTPCRGLVTPISPESGRLITKRQLQCKESDTSIDRPVYGKSPKDIIDNHLPAVLQNLWHEMQEAGLIVRIQPQNTIHDLSVIAINFEETFFDMHKKEWKDSTIRSYQGQYKFLIEDLKGIVPENLTTEAYIDLQYAICRHALKTSHDNFVWSPGKEAPESAKKRLNLLYQLILDLKRYFGYEIPVVPFSYNGKPSHDDLLLARTDNARSFPPCVTKLLCKNSEMYGQTALLLDTGLRISECVGLLYSSLHRIQGSQGELYYISVTGQFDKNTKKRTEFPKTKNSYRVIPVSVDLGRQLIDLLNADSDKHGSTPLWMMCSHLDKDDLESTNRAVSYHDFIGKFISGFLREENVFTLITNARAYTFDFAKQNLSLWSMLTCHSLRRNFCTTLYCNGIPIEDIYQQTGHVMKNADKKPAHRGKPPDELYAMCLQKYVRSTEFSPAHPLQYKVAGKHTQTEVLACSVELILPPNSTYEIIINDTEPGNNISVTSDNAGALEVNTIYSQPLPSETHSSEFLVRDELLTIQSKRYPFRSDK